MVDNNYAKKDNEIEKFTNLMIAKITSNLEKFNYNVIVANMYETYNYLVNYIKKNKDINNLKQNYIKLLLCFAPIIPHFSSECLVDIGNVDELRWPKYNPNLLEEEKVNIVLQINGKKRTILKSEKGIDETNILKIAKKDKIGGRYLENKEIIKVIFVKDKLINILLHD